MPTTESRLPGIKESDASLLYLLKQQVLQASPVMRYMHAHLSHHSTAACTATASNKTQGGREALDMHAKSSRVPATHMHTHHHHSASQHLLSCAQATGKLPPGKLALQPPCNLLRHYCHALTTPSTN